ncbi:hypothetical protein [Sphingomonas sp. NFR15]|uniref:hypothetical protein n=1 Tax=Sphingomonas sp. NFR15 TaxID=1566282 RepID=UPI00088DEF5C|nr:hypothetical protein [Sphingomonas sp. NFR15]SDA15177.1 hypothetical protein SAMN03159340_00654 [Sphingomonas sp. NFR15]
MTDRPIIFSAAMVRALLAGHKTQTRRLATSPLRHCAVGDRLYVREAFRVDYSANWYREDLGRCPTPSEMDPTCTGIEFFADGERELGGNGYPSMHMPRWASRLTLIVESVKVEPLQAISEADAAAEGAMPVPVGAPPGISDLTGWTHGQAIEPPDDCFLSAIASFRHLWRSLHAVGGARWEDNPNVVALTFRVERGNIDRISQSEQAL